MKEKTSLGRQITLYPLHEMSETEERASLPQETIEGLISLCKILRNIHNRLRSEGYAIINGSLYSPSGELLYERNQNNN